MELFELISGHMATLEGALVGATTLADAATRFDEALRDVGRQALEGFYQGRIAEVEAGRQGSRQIRVKHFHTPMGTIRLARRLFETPDGPVVVADGALGLPLDAWLPEVLEVGCALGIASEFRNARRLFTRWTGVVVCERTLANQVEAAGAALQEFEFAKPAVETAGPDSALAKLVATPQARPVVYVGIDGILVPSNVDDHANKEVLVGVVFKQADHRRLSEKRNEIRRRDYVATLMLRKEFGDRLYQVHSEAVGMTPYLTVVLGDGAKWIWRLAADKFPGGIQILDFFHVSEYVWDVARSLLQGDEARKTWVTEQQDRLKQSDWQTVVETVKALQPKSPEQQKTITDLVRYLRNNKSRIDYKAYLAAGYMIGSGVIESSNRRVVAQRLKQAGMHWSIQGVEGIVALRASYLSDSSRWQDYWKAQAA